MERRHGLKVYKLIHEIEDKSSDLVKLVIELLIECDRLKKEAETNSNTCTGCKDFKCSNNTSCTNGNQNIIAK